MGGHHPRAEATAPNIVSRVHIWIADSPVTERALLADPCGALMEQIYALPVVFAEKLCV
jgi:hypothetical protein